MTVWRLLQLLGAVYLMAVVLAHVAEAFCLFPEMGWGQPDSARYYLDLFGAALGLILFSASSSRQKKSASPTRRKGAIITGE
jgi:hypothetical protein